MQGRGVMTWAVYPTGIRIWLDGEYVGEIPQECWWPLIRKMGEVATQR